MARLIFENLSLQDAKIFAEWYEGQGEQNADIWFDVNDSSAPLVDVQGKGIEVKDDEVIVYLKGK